eukprot:GEMP01087607.1.p1 GENE.GEMP01087607.1~~GEMP01087607.1.p1  ORF type:complete len:234 (+),score=67.36 GEMP01087607.1:36-737(+)
MIRRNSSMGSKEMRRASRTEVLYSRETEEKEYITKKVTPTLEDLSLTFWQKPSDDPVAFFIELLREQGVPDPPEIFDEVDQSMVDTLQAQVDAIKEKIARITKLDDLTVQKEDPLFDSLNETTEKENTAPLDNLNDTHIGITAPKETTAQKEDDTRNAPETSDDNNVSENNVDDGVATTHKEDPVSENNVDDGAPTVQKEDTVTERDDEGSVEKKGTPPTVLEEDPTAPQNED